MVKKMMALALATIALAALTAPTVASADTWTVGGANVGSSTLTGTSITGTGPIAWTYMSGGNHVKLGPCEVHLEGRIWNNSGVAHGEVTNLVVTTPCDVFVNGTKTCTLTAKFAANFPWTVSTSGTKTTIGGVNFTETLSAGCPLGPGFGVSGTATGTFSGSTISFEGVTDDVKGPTENPVDMLGSVTLEGPEEEEVTMHS